jgi:hypothetical protein
MVRFYRAALGAPAWSSFMAALRSGILRLPGLTAEIAARNPDASVPSALGHLSLERQGLRSTKPLPLPTPKPESPPITESPPPPCSPADVLEFKVLPVDAKFLDYTAAFPQLSRRGMRYLLVSTRKRSTYAIPHSPAASTRTFRNLRILGESGRQAHAGAF